MSLKKFLNVYEFETVLPGSNEKVKYKGLSTNTMKKLIIHENEKDPLKEEDILDHILSVSIIDEDFDVDKLYVLDRYYLFIKIREATKGSVYKFQYTCPECNGQTVQSIDLKTLILKKTKIKNNTISLLKGNVKLELDYPKRKNQKEAYSYINPKLSDREKSIDIQLADLAAFVTHIKTSDGEQDIDYTELIDFIGELPENEKDVFDQWIEKNKFGIDLKHVLKCPHCEFETERDLPMQNFFS